MKPQPPIHAVILAAGDGGRLGEHTQTMPKPLIPVSGRPLIAYALDSLHEAGCRSVTVVVGYRAAQLSAGVLASAPRGLEVAFAENPRFHGGASLSLRAARQSVGGRPSLLLMADHMLSAPILRALVAAWSGGPSEVAVDSSAWPEHYLEEATRVRIDPRSRLVTAIGKGLEPWDALDTGAFLLAPEAWQAIDAAPEDCELSVVFSELARRGELRAVDVSGASWYDVDTEADLAAVSDLAAAGGGR